VEVVLKALDIKLFHFCSGPRSLAQKIKAGFDRWIALEAVDGHCTRHFFPREMLRQLIQDHCEGYSMKRVVALKSHNAKLGAFINKAVGLIFFSR
jgi:hypothetical protein